MSKIKLMLVVLSSFIKFQFIYQSFVFLTLSDIHTSTQIGIWFPRWYPVTLIISNILDDIRYP